MALVGCRTYGQTGMTNTYIAGRVPGLAVAGGGGMCPNGLHRGGCRMGCTTESNQ